LEYIHLLYVARGSQLSNYLSVQSPDTAELFHPVLSGPAGKPPPSLPPSEPKIPKLPLVLAKPPWHSPLELAVPVPYWFTPDAEAVPALSITAGRTVMDPIAIVIIARFLLFIMLSHSLLSGAIALNHSKLPRDLARRMYTRDVVLI
jgi:hypothetical protein